MGDVAVLPERAPRSARRDPMLGRDIGFYLFTLPLLEMLHGPAAWRLADGGRGGRARTCSARKSGSSRRAALFVSRRATRHLGAARGAAAASSSAFGAWLQIPQLLTTRPASLPGRPTPTSTRGCPRSWVARRRRGARAPRWRSGRRCATGRLVADRRARPALYVVVSIGGSAYAGDHSALRRRAERAGARDAVHRAQHPGDARGVRRSTAWPSGRCRETRT